MENDKPNRVVLENVPYIGFDAQRTGGKFEDTEICAAMRSALEYLGDPYPYEFLMGVSGAAFRIAWNAEWLDGGNLSTRHMGDDPNEHIRRMFDSVGWKPHIVANRNWRQVNESQPGLKVYTWADLLGNQVETQEEAFFRDWIVEEMHSKGHPMLALGVVGSDGCILAGYDEGGDVLIGWAHFQDWDENKNNPKVSYEPAGFFRKRDWFQDTVGLIGFLSKTGKPPIEDVYRSAVEWAVKLGRTERFGRYYSGLAAYPAWAGMLKEDTAFTAADAKGLDWLLMCHNDTLGATWGGRIYAADFLRSGARQLPRWAESYEAAADSYSAEIKVFEKIAEQLGGFGSEPEKAQKFAQPEARAAILPLILEARAQDERAIEHLEKTLG